MAFLNTPAFLNVATFRVFVSPWLRLQASGKSQKAQGNMQLEAWKPRYAAPYDPWDEPWL